MSNSRHRCPAVVRQADAAIIEEAGEAIPAPEHIVNGLSHGRMPREPDAMLAHPGFEFADERSAALPADGETLPGRRTALDLEERVDTGDGLECDRRDRRSFAATPGIGGDVGEHVDEMTILRRSSRRKLARIT
jgi:hypothetical protein